MQFWLQIMRGIDRFNGWVGKTAAWLCLIMVVLGAYNAVVRYLGRYLGTNLSSNAYIELQWYMFSAIFLLGAAYTLSQNAHVRVDVVYGRLSRRARAWIDLAGTVLFLIPFCAVTAWLSWPSVRNSFQVLEMSPDPGGLPRYPLKALILIAFGLLILQGIALAIRQVAILRTETFEEDGRAHHGEGL